MIHVVYVHGAQTLHPENSHREKYKYPPFRTYKYYIRYTKARARAVCFINLDAHTVIYCIIYNTCNSGFCMNTEKELCFLSVNIYRYPENFYRG